MTECNKEICNRYGPETILCFIDRELDIEMHRAVKKHLASCQPCRMMADIYGSIDYLFESRINADLSGLDFVAIKSATMERIESKTGNIVEKIYKLLSTIFSAQRIKSYLQTFCFVTAIFCSLFYFQRAVVKDHTPVAKSCVAVQSSTLSLEHPATVSSLPLDTPTAIITSVNGNVSSLMILESEDKKMTIIWYKEV